MSPLLGLGLGLGLGAGLGVGEGLGLGLGIGFGFAFAFAFGFGIGLGRPVGGGEEQGGPRARHRAPPARVRRELHAADPAVVRLS